MGDRFRGRRPEPAEVQSASRGETRVPVGINVRKGSKKRLSSLPRDRGFLILNPVLDGNVRFELSKPDPQSQDPE